MSMYCRTQDGVYRKIAGRIMQHERYPDTRKAKKTNVNY